jgi:antitoxin MazE
MVGRVEEALFVALTPGCHKPEETNPWGLVARDGGVYIMYKQEALTVKARIQKWGNSLGIRIPRALAQETAVDSESVVDISSHNGRIIITPDRQKSFSLRQLLSKVTDENLHDEVSTGGAIGKEIW